MFEDLSPKWIKILSDPNCKCVLIYGCGGGFDFTHSLLLIPSLFKAGKKVVVVSNSFTAVDSTYIKSEIYFQGPFKSARLIIPRNTEILASYAPEQAMVDFLSQRYKLDNFVLYANDIHAFLPKLMTNFLTKVIKDHNVDTLITLDGGTDSLMRGDEADYATIMEDFCSLVVADNLKGLVKNSMLLVCGFGVDRFHGASDASSLRAVAELTRMGGFYGSLTVDQASESFHLYSDYLLYYSKLFPDSAHSIVGSFIAASIVGQYGPYQDDIVPRRVPRSFIRSGIPLSAVEFFNLDQEGNNSDSIHNKRVKAKDGYIWPLMSQIYGFDIQVIMERNLLADSFRNADNTYDLDNIYKIEKKKLNVNRLKIENIPLAQQMNKKF